MSRQDIDKSYLFYICRLISINNNSINYRDILKQDAYNYRDI